MGTVGYPFACRYSSCGGLVGGSVMAAAHGSHASDNTRQTRPELWWSVMYPGPGKGVQWQWRQGQQDWQQWPAQCEDGGHSKFHSVVALQLAI
jgi:hypothetical protein